MTRGIDLLVRDLERSYAIMTNEWHKRDVRLVAESEFVRLCDDARGLDRVRVAPYVLMYVRYKLNGG
jgi:hypothetical protein